MLTEGELNGNGVGLVGKGEKRISYIRIWIHNTRRSKAGFNLGSYSERQGHASVLEDALVLYLCECGCICI